VSTPESQTPFVRLGGEPAVTRLVERFYDVMAEREPALARLHALEPSGRITQDSRDRFALFLIGWLGGPQTYMERHGHPRLRMRHGHVPIDQAMRDAWIRSMTAALDAEAVSGELRQFLDGKLAALADFLRNAG
jgi:hemoglobin